MNVDAMGGRRFVLAFATLLIASVLVGCKSISGSEYVTLMLGTVAAFITAGTWDHHVDAVTAASPTPPP